MRTRDLHTAAACLRDFFAGHDTPRAWAGGMLLAAAAFAWIPQKR